MAQQAAIGIDLGGTAIKAGLVTSKGKSLKNLELDTQSEKGPQAVLQSICEAAEQLLDSSEMSKWQQETEGTFAGIGVGSPGIVDYRRGIVDWGADNIPGWKGTDILSPLKDRFDCPVEVTNDASAFIWGEYLFGVGNKKEIQNAVGITLGTGIGGGVILDGKLFRGSHGYAAEPGHTVITDRPDAPMCNCGNRGCVEVFAGGMRMMEYTLSRQKDYPDSEIFRISRPEEVSPKTLHEAALKDDPLALEVLDRMTLHLGMGIASQICAFDPQIAIVGGGISRMGKILFDRLDRDTRKFVYYSEMWMPPIIPAKLGNDAGYMGAAGLTLFPEGAFQKG